MSYAAIDWAMPKVIKDVNAKSCLVVLAYHHNKETGLCCPSISTIADEMGVRSLNTVRKAIGVLVEMNLLTMSREFGDRGGAERLWVSSVGTDRDLMIVCRNHRCTVYQI